MSFFCFLWIPLFYLFRRSFSPGCGTGAVWALVLGSITALLQFIFGNIVTPGGFGFYRWLYGFVDIVSMAVLLPFLVYGILVFFKKLPEKTSFANFALLWIIPTASIRALVWSTSRDPILLVLAPLLWAALAVGIQFFMELMIERIRWYVILLCVLCILLLPVAAATAYWAFFSHRNLLGYIILGVTLVPMVFSTVMDLLHVRRNKNKIRPEFYVHKI